MVFTEKRLKNEKIKNQKSKIKNRKLKPLFQKRTLRWITPFSSYPYDPVRDRILVDENRFFRKRRAVRYAISFNVYHVPNVTSEATGDTFFYQYHVPNGTILHPVRDESPGRTEIMFPQKQHPVRNASLTIAKTILVCK